MKGRNKAVLIWALDESVLYGHATVSLFVGKQSKRLTQQPQRETQEAASLLI
jgi:hypothetical protein